MQDKKFTREKPYTTAEAAELGGVAYPTLGYLNSKNILKPSVRVGGHQGAPSLYSFADILALRSISALRQVPAALGSLRGVAKFWQSPQGIALADGEAVGKVLVVTPSGTVTLEDDAPVLVLTGKYETNLLHVINIGGLVRCVHIEATEQHTTEPAPKPRGRPPGPRSDNRTRVRGEERTEPRPRGEQPVRAKKTTGKKKKRRSR